MSPIQALRSATIAPAELFGVTDRGRFEPDRRANLVPVEGDPTTDIRSNRGISRVRAAGMPAG